MSLVFVCGLLYVCLWLWLWVLVFKPADVRSSRRWCSVFFVLCLCVGGGCGCVCSFSRLLMCVLKVAVVVVIWCMFVCGWWLWL